MTFKEKVEIGTNIVHPEDACATCRERIHDCPRRHMIAVLVRQILRAVGADGSAPKDDLLTTIEILGSMVVGQHLESPASQESSRDKAQGILAETLGKTWDPERGEWSAVGPETTGVAAGETAPSARDTGGQPGGSAPVSGAVPDAGTEDTSIGGRFDNDLWAAREYMAKKDAAPDVTPAIHKTWSCKVGEVHPNLLPKGADWPMREAVARAYKELTGEEPAFIFSGWAAKLTESERAVHEGRSPVDQPCPRCGKPGQPGEGVWVHHFSDDEAACHSAETTNLTALRNLCNDPRWSNEFIGQWARFHLSGVSQGDAS